MKTYFLLITIIILSFSAYSQENEKSTYFLIRHAEKNRTDTINKNPNLNLKGKKRAAKWNQILTNFSIEEIYSTNYNRTIQTGKPIAKAKNLTIKTYHPFKIDIENFIAETNGKNILIVGHSNTTASFANKLIGQEIYPEIEDDNNSNLYIVTIDGKQISHVLIKMQ